MAGLFAVPEEISDFGDRIFQGRIFVRQKTYIEVEEKENGEDKYLVCCAGLPKSCKESLIDDFRSGRKDITDFKKGLKIKGKLMQKRIHGGVILYEDYFTMS